MNVPVVVLPIPPRRQSEARKIAEKHYPFVCCVICGLQLRASLEVAHLDHQAGNNEPDNLAWLCGTHHKMVDCDFYPIKALKLIRAKWQVTKGVPSHAGRMKDAGPKSAETKRRKAAEKKKSLSAKKAWATRRLNAADEQASG